MKSGFHKIFTCADKTFTLRWSQMSSLVIRPFWTNAPCPDHPSSDAALYVHLAIKHPTFPCQLSSSESYSHQIQDAFSPRMINSGPFVSQRVLHLSGFCEALLSKKDICYDVVGPVWLYLSAYNIQACFDTQNHFWIFTKQSSLF